MTEETLEEIRNELGNLGALVKYLQEHLGEIRQKLNLLDESLNVIWGLTDPEGKP